MRIDAGLIIGVALEFIIMLYFANFCAILYAAIPIDGKRLVFVFSLCHFLL